VMIKQLNELGFDVMMSITPFLEPESPNAQEAVRHNFVVSKGGKSPYAIPWRQGQVYLLDVSNPYALDWWAERLWKLQQITGLAGYKFTAGEANYLPADAKTYGSISRNRYSELWVQFAALNFPYCEVCCGWECQRNPILFSQWDKFNTWGFDKGLASVISTMLALSMTGYAFVLPDMIGGNVYNGTKPDKELFIRWTQAVAPMLSMQFSAAPWDYDAETVEICRKYAQLHIDLAEARLAAARGTTETGDPVIRPVFWTFPLDPFAQSIDDQYLVGNAHLVAPILTANTTQRDILLPPGQWRDYWSNEIFQGNRWLRDYPAPLDTLPIFERINP
jgi:myogenesis-regulating glycosidase